MKKLLYTFSLLFPFISNSQITISSSDMPDVNMFSINDVDTYRISVINGPDTFSLSNTGAGSVWDYSSLVPQSQKVDTFVNTLNTDPQYYVNFNYPGDQEHFASYAQPVSPPPDFNSGFQLTDVYYYFKETSSQYTQVGFGAKLNGISISQKYDPVDVIYEFPLDFNDVSTSTSFFKLTVPTYGYYSRTTQRNNTVDGWGSLTTPFGTFQSLRVRSELKNSDTLFLDTLGFGFPVPRPTQYEYKWLAKNMGIPLLQINTQKTGSSEVISQILYRDSVRLDIVNVKNIDQTYSNIKIFPNPSNGRFQLIIDKNHPEKEMVFIRNIIGETIFSSNILNLTSQISYLTSHISFDFPNGIYFVQIGSQTEKLIITR